MSEQANNSVIALYKTHDAAENAVKILAQASISMKEISVIGKGYHSEEKVVGFYNIGERVQFWGKYGAFWGSLWAILAGGLFLSTPLIGPVLVLGGFAAVVLAAIEGAVVGGGIGALGAALFSIGIPKDTILQYEDTLKADGFLVLVQGTADEVKHAHEILNTSKAAQVDVHCCGAKSSGECATPKVKIAS